VLLLCKSPPRRSSNLQPPLLSAAAACRGPGMPARPRRGPGKPGPACVRVHPRSKAKPCPHLAASPLGQVVPHTVPRHDPATALRCAVKTQRGRDVTFTSWPSPLRHSLEHAQGACHTHTSTHTHATTQDPSRTGSGSHTRSDGRLTSGPCLGPFC
jgi:hypothetical protein